MHHAHASLVAGNLWVGGDLDTRDLELARKQLDELDRVGVTDILDLRLEWDDQEWVREGAPHIRYLWLGVDDAGQRMPDEWFDRGVAHSVAAIRRGATVLTHCHMGINRGPSMGFAIMLALGWSPAAALDRIRGRRPIAHVGYAEDAVDWWLRRSGATTRERTAGALQVQRWTRANHMDVADVIRKIRSQESS
ncbi:MAG: hypothetical protein EOO27_23030 [Comamonadaceae bacterium]|nr:MAG: hypothetical protein EOO27_23030 [Comamonadaceae bacterium]